MDLTNTVTSINTQTLAYLPAVIAGIHAAETFAPAGATGQQKLDAVLAGVGASSAELTNSPNQNVAAVASLVNLSVMIANLLGAFRHKSAAQ